VIALVAVGLLAARNMQAPMEPNEAAMSLEQLLHDTVEGAEQVRNGVLLVDAPSLGVQGTWAAGTANHLDGSPMTTETPFISASVGKLFTAATVLSLVDDGLLSMDDDITMWLEPDVYSGIPVEGDDDALREVTVRRLLGQRSGIPDYFEGDTADGAPNVMALTNLEPDRQWTPLTLLDYTKEHFEPAGAPGEDFEYTDTNYDLLGLMVEAVTGKPFHETVAERVLRPLDLWDTWYHGKTDPPRAEMAQYADVWYGDTNTARTPALSLDWAGGGLATTTADLHKLMRGLQDGRPVQIEALQEEWSEDAISNGIDYGYGLWRIQPADVFFLLRGYPEMHGASGVTGSYVYYVPDFDAVIAGTFDQTEYADDHVRFLIDVLDRLRRVATGNGT
jgi:D-alanyl-D-alanine carboxypeptidase